MEIIDVRPLFADERRDLLALLASLSSSDWERPTTCPGWGVRDIATHVLNDYVRRLSNGRDHHAGAVFADDETLPAYLARVNDEFVRAMRQSSPAVLIDLLGHLGPQLNEHWYSSDLSAVAPIAVSWAEGHPEADRVWLDIAREYTEFWVHQQQIRDATGRPGGDEPHLMTPVVRTFALALPNALRRVEAAPSTSVRLEVTGASGGTWLAVRTDAGWVLGDAHGGREPDAKVSMDQDTFWRLASRGIGVAEARERSQLLGRTDLTDAVTELLAIVY